MNFNFPNALLDLCAIYVVKYQMNMRKNIVSLGTNSPLPRFALIWEAMT